MKSDEAIYGPFYYYPSFGVAVYVSKGVVKNIGLYGKFKNALSKYSMSRYKGLLPYGLSFDDHQNDVINKLGSGQRGAGGSIHWKALRLQLKFRGPLLSITIR